jgi:hypothetical protein
MTFDFTETHSTNLKQGGESVVNYEIEIEVSDWAFLARNLADPAGFNVIVLRFCQNVAGLQAILRDICR